MTLFGSNFTSDAVVLFGSNLATGVTLVSPNELQVVAPGGAPGSVDVFLSQISGSDTLTDAYFYTDTLLRVESKNAPIGGTVVSRALGTSDVPLAGFSCAVELDGLYLDVIGVSLDGTVAEGAEFFSSDFANSLVPGGTWWICGVVMSFAQTIAIPPGVDQPYVAVTYGLSPATPSGNILLLDLVDGGGVPPTDLVFVPSSGISITPSHVDGVLIAIEGGFVRGDSNQDSTVDVADPVSSLAFLFTSGPGPCPDAMDGNDDGVVDIADPVFVLTWLFSGGPPPPAPFPSEGADPTPDPLGC